jgi:hypothetical protein
MELRPIRAWFSTVAPMPISEFSPTRQPCRIARWPIVQPSPTIMGAPMSV